MGFDYTEPFFKQYVVVCDVWLVGHGKTKQTLWIPHFGSRQPHEDCTLTPSQLGTTWKRVSPFVSCSLFTLMRGLESPKSRLHSLTKTRAADHVIVFLFADMGSPPCVALWRTPYKLSVLSPHPYLAPYWCNRTHHSKQIVEVRTENQEDVTSHIE